MHVFASMFICVLTLNMCVLGICVVQIPFCKHVMCVHNKLSLLLLKSPLLLPIPSSSLYLDLGLLRKSNCDHILIPIAELAVCLSFCILVYCLCHMDSLQEGSCIAVSSGHVICVKYKPILALFIVITYSEK